MNRSPPSADAGIRMTYLVPYAILSRWTQRYIGTHAAQLDLPYAHYISIIRRFLEPVPVDETWYRAAYPGIANAIERGVFRSSLHHYLAHGYFENRSPFAPDRADLRQPVSFADIRASTPVRPTRDGLHVTLSWDELMRIAQRLLQSVPVDEAWYRKSYPALDAAIAAGKFGSAASHFVQHGYCEGRWPFDMPVDETWYLGRYPDVANAVSASRVSSAREHFWRTGYGEGRFPARRFFTQPEPDHAAAA